MWKALKEYPNYMVNENGDVFSLNINKTLRPSNTNGYKQVVLMKNGQRHTILVHRLVANAFIENPNNLPCINHKDENRLNNKASNLEWCTYQHNNTYCQRHCRAGIKLRKPVSQYNQKGQIIDTYESVKAAAEATGMRKEGIARAARGERKTYKGFLWKWANQIRGDDLSRR